ncbi:autotransporter-associated beta strand repeat-containing protein [Prosthecobacter sp.]|uniref:autotransporter-associated beta strand repeat-containing protein n=1 Tax=Prosthecobacter sp. TaxID=1965333 RepID=UPI0037830540
MRLDAAICHTALSFFSLIIAFLTASSADAATVIYDGGTTGTGTTFDTAVNWSGDAIPVTTSEALFNTSIVLPAQLTTSTTTNTWGDLIWNTNVSSALTLNSTAATNRNLVLSGGGGSTEAIAQGGATGDLILLGTNAVSNTLAIGGNAGTGTGVLNMALGASGNFDVVNSGATLSISSLISGNFNLTKTGAGTLTLSGANSFGSATTSFTLNAGTVNVNSATALGASTNTFVINGGTFDNTSGAAITTSSYKQTWNSSFTFTGTNNLTLGSGAISLGTTAGTSRTVTVGAGMLSMSGVISNGTTATSIVKDGAGTLSLSGASTFTGGVVVKNGTLYGGSSTAFGTAAGTITLGNTSGSLSASLMGSGAASPTFANPIVVVSGSSGNTLTMGTGPLGTLSTIFSGTVSLGHDLVLSNASTGMTTLSGVISETGGARSIAVVAGTGTVSLTNTNTFSGGVTLNNGRLILGVTNATGTGPLTITGGVLDTTSTSSGTAATLNNSAYFWNGDFSTGGTTAITLAGGNVTLGGSRVVTTDVINSAIFTINGGIGDGGNGYSLTKAGGAVLNTLGVLNLNGASTYSGATIVMGGVLNLIQSGSTLTNTSGVVVTAGTLNLGVTSGTGVANRINPAANLALGGSGIFTLNAGATGPVNSQSFAALNVNAGSSQLGTSSATNAGTFSFTGAAGSVYSRSTGGVVRILVGTNTSFVNAPTGSSVTGTGTSAILIGAVSGTTVTATSMTDFVKAAAGVISAPDYGTNLWSSGVNTTLTNSLSVSGNTQSLRFNTSGAMTVTLGGTSTLESGGILVTSAALGGGAITGGQIQAAGGKDLWAYISTLATSTQGLKIASLIADNGGSSLTKGGGGVLYLTNAGNTYTGGTYLGEGTLNITSGGALGTGALNFTGNATLQAGGATVDLGTRAITIAAGQVAFINSNGSGNTITVSGVISGDGGLTKNGAGTLVLSGANTYTGDTTFENGTLKLDFSAAGAPVSNILPAGSLFSPGGGSFSTLGAFSQTFIIQGKDGTANSQILSGGLYTNVSNYNTAGIYLNKGMSHLNFVAGGNGGTLVVDVGFVSRGYSTDPNNAVDFSIGSGVTVLSTGISASNFATVNGNTWATVSGGQLIGLPTASYSTSYSTVNAVLDVGTGGTLSANPGSLRFNNNSAATVAPGTGVVRDIVTGGILVTPNVGANTSTISAGLLAGYGARDLIIHQNNTAGSLQIDAGIVDFAGRTTTISKNGLGTVLFTAANTNTGVSFVNEGTLVVMGDAVSSFTRTATDTSGSPVLTMSDTSNIFLGQAVTEATTLTTTSTTWTVVAINPNVSVTLSNNAAGSVTNGTFTFGAGSALGGSTSLTHYIAPGATLQIGNGGTTGSLLTGNILSNNGTVIINRSNDLTFTNVMNGTGAFEKQGTGNLTVSGANTITGDTRISGGSVILGAATALASSTLDYGSYGGSLSFGSLTAATLGGLKGGQNLVLSNASAAAVTLTVGGNQQDTAYSGALSGLGSLAKTGGGVLTLSGASTNAGTISVSIGTLNLAGTFTATGAVSSSGTSVLNMAGTFTDLPTLTIAGSLATLSGSLVRSGAYSNLAGLTVSAGIFNVTGTLGTSAAVPLGQTAFSGNSVTNFSGTEYLSGASTTFRIGEGSSATVNVTAGTLTVGSGSAGLALGRSAATASGFLNVSGGTVDVEGTSTVVRIGAGYADADNSGASVLTLSGTGIFTTGTTTAQFLLGSNLAGNTASSGTFNLDGGTLMTNRIITGGTVGASIFNFNGGTFKATGTAATLATSLTTVNVRNGGAVIDSNGFNIAIAKSLLHSTIGGDTATDGGLTKQGSGTLTLSGANTYTGATTVNGGTLKAGSTSAFGSGSAVTLANTAGVTLDITGFNTTVGSLSGGGAAGGNVTLGAATLTTGGDNSSTTYSGVISGTGGGVTKAGAGTLVFTAANTYTGSTTVSGGNLQVGAAGVGKSGSGATSINGAGAVLSGTGVVQGAATITLGLLSPGDSGGVSEGTLSFASGLTFNHATPSTAVALTIQGSTTANETGDRLSVTGALSLDADSMFVVNHGADWTPTTDQSWTLMDWTGLLTLNGWSAGGNLSLPDLSSYNLGWNVSDLLDGSTGGALVVSIVTVVPEPSRAMLLLAALAFFSLRRRRSSSQFCH